MRKILCVVGLFAMLLEPGLALADQSKEEAIRDSVVKIYSSLRSPDLVKPWQKQTPAGGHAARASSSRGSGS